MTKCDVSRAFGWAILPSHFPTGYYAIQVKEKKVKKEKQKESIKSGLGLIVLSTLSHSTRRNRLNGFRDYNRGNSRLINSVHGMNNATLIDNKRGNGIREGGLFQPLVLLFLEEVARVKSGFFFSFSSFSSSRECNI